MPGACTARSNCISARRTPSLIVPASAIIFNQHGVHVAVVRNDVVHLQKINIARDLGTEIEVRDGVEEGDELILRFPVDIRDGQRRSDTPDAFRPPRRSDAISSSGTRYCIGEGTTRGFYFLSGVLAEGDDAFAAVAKFLKFISALRSCQLLLAYRAPKLQLYPRICYATASV